MKLCCDGPRSRLPRATDRPERRFFFFIITFRKTISFVSKRESHLSRPDRMCSECSSAPQSCLLPPDEPSMLDRVHLVDLQVMQNS